MKIIMLILVLIICMSFQVVKAPAVKYITIFEAEKISKFDPLLFAFEYVESSFDPDTINILGYGGILQIGQEMIDEVNRVCKLIGDQRRFTLNDRLIPEKAEQMWYIIHNYWNKEYIIRKACKIWNPLASSKYYDKIRQATIDAMYYNLYRELFN